MLFGSAKLGRGWVGVAVLGLSVTLFAPVAFAFDGTPTGEPSAKALQGAREAAQAIRGNSPEAMRALQYLAENGNIGAQWKIGRMYSTGEGIGQDDLRAFEAFRHVATRNADVAPNAPNARFISAAYVRLGEYWLEGIPNTYVKPNAEFAYEHFRFAASTFGDSEAQYHLGRLLLEGHGCDRDARQAAQWLSSAAAKSHPKAQAVLGKMLFWGKDVPRQAPRGLMFLTLAKDGAPAEEVWIASLYEEAIEQSTDDERNLALTMMKQWLAGRR